MLPMLPCPRYPERGGVESVLNFLGRATLPGLGSSAPPGLSLSTGYALPSAGPPAPRAAAGVPNAAGAATEREALSPSGDGWPGVTPVMFGGTGLDSLPVPPMGRLTTESGVGVSASDRTAQATIYYTPYYGSLVPIYDGVRWRLYEFAELSHTLASTAVSVAGDTTNGSAVVTNVSPDTTGLHVGMPVTGTGIPDGAVIQSIDSATQFTMSANATATGTGVVLGGHLANQDVYVILQSGVPALTAGTQSWDDNTTRDATRQIVYQDGILVEETGGSYSTYVGTVRLAGITGGTTVYTEDSVTKRYVWNHYHRVPRTLRARESAASWNYTTATFRQANANTANRVQVVAGQADAALDLSVFAVASNGTLAGVSAGIGEDSTTVNHADVVGGRGVLNGVSAPFDNFGGRLVKPVPLGYHAYNWLEMSAAAGTTTWYGDGTSGVRTGLTGHVMG